MTISIGRSVRPYVCMYVCVCILYTYTTCTWQTYYSHDTCLLNAHVYMHICVTVLSCYIFFLARPNAIHMLTLFLCFTLSHDSTSSQLDRYNRKCLCMRPVTIDIVLRVYLVPHTYLYTYTNSRTRKLSRKIFRALLYLYMCSAKHTRTSRSNRQSTYKHHFIFIAFLIFTCFLLCLLIFICHIGKPVWVLFWSIRCIC